MQRTLPLILAAGIAGAAFASIFAAAVSTPAHASEGPYAVEATTGTVDVLSLLEQMLDTEPYAGEREAETNAWNAQLAELEAQINGTVQQLQSLDPNNPDPAVAQPLYQQYQSLNQRYQQLQQERGVALDRFSAGQLTEAYEKIHAAVQVVAEAQGVDRVFSTRLSADDLESNNTNVVVQEVLLRPVLRDTTAIRLTPLVRAELGMPEPAEEAEAEATDPAPAETPGDDGGN